MKIISVSRTQFVSYMILSFLIGLVLSQTVIKSLRTNPMPDGNWVSIYAGDTLSLQVNTTLAETKGRSITTWIREDRNNEFLTSHGVQGKTILSRITIDCEDLKMKVHEQHSFSTNLSPIASIESEEPLNFPVDIMEIVSIVKICDVPIPSSAAEKSLEAQPFKAHKKTVPMV